MQIHFSKENASTRLVLDRFGVATGATCSESDSNRNTLLFV